MARLLKRAVQYGAGYLGVILAVIAAGFLANRLGWWAAVLWVVLLGTGIYLVANRRRDPGSGPGQSSG
jgi:hypothetical protein